MGLLTGPQPAPHTRRPASQGPGNVAWPGPTRRAPPRGCRRRATAVRTTRPLHWRQPRFGEAASSRAGGLARAWRGRRQRRGGAAVPSSSGILRRVPPILPTYELMAGGPPRGVAGKRGSACSAGLSFEAAHWPMQVCALHCIALRDARALLPCVHACMHQLAHNLFRCTVPQVATMVDRQDRPGRGWRAEFGAL